MQVLFESRLYERSLAIFFSTFLEHASLVESESVSSQEESPREFSPEGWEPDRKKKRSDILLFVPDIKRNRNALNILRIDAYH